MSTVLMQLNELQCPRCDRKLRVNTDRPISGAEEAHVLSAKCRCGYSVNASSLTEVEACATLLSLVAFPNASITSATGSPYKRRSTIHNQPHTEAA